jgi:hypothetical protein
MKTRAFQILVVLSLVCAALLAFGYVSRFGPMIANSWPSGTARAFRELDVTIEEGGVRIVWATGTSSTVAAASGWITRWSFHLRAPSIKRSFWEFDARALPPAGVASTVTVFLIRFPLWCLILPWLIAPAIWLRRRRAAQSKEARGFAVETATGPGVHPVASA